MKRREMLVCALGCGAMLRLAHADVPAKRFRLAYLSLTPDVDKLLMPSFFAGLGEAGFVEGQQFSVAFVSAEGEVDRLLSLARNLVQNRPDVIIAGFGTLTAKAAAGATQDIPIVFTTVADPVGAGIVKSLARPGGNISGMSAQLSDIGGKLLEILREVASGAKTIAILRNPGTPATSLALVEVERAASVAGMPLLKIDIRDAAHLKSGMTEIGRSNAGGVVVLGDPLLLSLRKEIASYAQDLKLPTIFGDRSFAEAGGLMSYGPDRRVIFHRAARFVARVLGGAQISELAVEQPTDFELVINAGTASKIGLTLSQQLLNSRQ